MHVKGVAYVARESFLKRQLGEGTWTSFIRDWMARHPAFPQPVMPISKIPHSEFLALNDEILRRFFGNDQQALWTFGEESGRYALTQGQLKGLFQPGEYRKFLHLTPAIWKGYFDGGELTLKDAPAAVDIRITGIPGHVYFEYSVMGFAKGGLEVLGQKEPKLDRVKGFSHGDDEVLYRFAV